MSEEANHQGVSWSIPRSRRGRALLLLLVVVVVAAAVLYYRPTHHYQVSGNSKSWIADVKTALAKGGAGGTIAPSGVLRELPGVGKIEDIIVEKATLRKGIEVLFLTGTGANDSGLAYLDGVPPPPDSCNVHLGGPWWQITPINIRTMGCPRGFNFTGAP